MMEAICPWRYKKVPNGFWHCSLYDGNDSCWEQTDGFMCKAAMQKLAEEDMEGTEPIPPHTPDPENLTSEEKTRYDEQSKHYDAGGIEVIEVIRAKLTKDQYIGYLLGNIIKYATRFNFKGQAGRDADKLAWYSMWLDEAMEE